MFHKVKYNLIIYILFFSQSFCNRKYNIEQECLQLYGEDLKSVLLGFRRSSEYLSILTKEIGEYQEYFSEIKGLVVQKYFEELGDKVIEIFNVTKDTEKHKILRMRHLTSYNNIENKFLHRKNIRFRQVDGETETTSQFSTTRKTPAQEVDEKAQKIWPKLAYDDQVTARNLGFEYTGKIIHALIKAVSDGEAVESDEIKSTRLPDGGIENGRTTETTTPHEEHTVQLNTPVVLKDVMIAQEGPHNPLRQKKGNHKKP